MKISRGIMGLLSMVMLAMYACREQPLKPADIGRDQLAPGMIKGKAPDNHVQLNFRAHLKGENEVPAVETNAQGQAIFSISEDGNSIHYKLIASNIQNVMMAHIHIAPAGESGPIVVWLYPSAPPPQLIEGRFQGVLAEGTFTADDLTGPLEGKTLQDLIEEMRAGNTYVNAHTSQNPAGEIRGQIH